MRPYLKRRSSTSNQQCVSAYSRVYGYISFPKWIKKKYILLIGILGRHWQNTRADKKLNEIKYISWRNTEKHLLSVCNSRYFVWLFRYDGCSTSKFFFLQEEVGDNNRPVNFVYVLWKTGNYALNFIRTHLFF